MSALKAVNINLIQFEPIVTMATAAAEMAARTHSNNPPGNETRLIRLRGQTPPHEHISPGNGFLFVNGLT